MPSKVNHHNFIELIAKVQYNMSVVEAPLLISSYIIDDVYFAIEEKDSTGKKSYKKITELRIGGEIWIVVKAQNLKNKKVNITILDTNSAIAIKQESGINVVPILVEENEKTIVEITLDQQEENEETKCFGAKKIRLRPKSDTDLKTLKENIKNTTDKKAKLYLSADANTPNSDIEDTQLVYDGNENPNDTTLSNVWLNGNELSVYSCFCDRGFTRDEVIEFIYKLRDGFGYVTHREKFFDLGTDYLTNRTTDLANNKDKVDSFKNELNTMFTNYGINTCKRKIHFLSQMYIETYHFRSTHEATGVCSSYEGGCDFRGRGMKQITHDYNYLAYYDYNQGTNYSNVFDNLRGSSVGAAVLNYLDQIDPQTNQQITTSFYNNTLKAFIKKLSQNLFEAFDSAGWFSTVYRSDVLSKMDNGLTNDDVKKVTKAINGGENNLSDRQNAATHLKGYFNYENQCINN